MHEYNISPNGKWAIHTRSSANQPPVVDLVSLPDHAMVKTLEDNSELTAKLSQLACEPTEFLQVDIGDGVVLDGWCVRPPNMHAEKKYPLLIYVYGEPAGATVVNRWGGDFLLVALDDGARRLRGDELRQSGNKSAARSSLA